MGCAHSDLIQKTMESVTFTPSPSASIPTTDTAEARLFRSIGGREQLVRMTTIFYENMLKDPHLSRFVADATDPHALRFALWLEQQMTGARVWDADRAERAKCPVHRTVGSGHNTFVHVVHDRTSAHVAAWYSTKRPPAEQGRRFKLYDTRLWMRLHFMASRQAGLLENKEFADFYASFIGEFAGVYEITAPPFAREDMAWSESSERIEAYLAAGRRMPDLKPYAPGSR